MLLYFVKLQNKINKKVEKMISTLGELPALPPYRLFRGMM
jgi:hypothetical protein